MKKILIEAKNIRFKYPRSYSNALNNINLAIFKGDFISIIGDNASGKSTLCKVLTGLIPTYINGDFSGEVLYNGVPINNIHISHLSKKIGYVFQDFENQLVQDKVIDEIEFVAQNFGFIDYKERACQTMKELGISHLKDEFIHTLSGGQKHLLTIASVLVFNPEVLILDEPTLQLSPYNQIKIYEILQNINKKFNTTIIVIEHNYKFIKDYAKQILYLESGKLRFSKPIIDIDNLNFHLNTCSFKHPKKLGSQILNITHLNHKYQTLNKDYHQILHDINLSFYENERVVILGENGAGKSTLLELISGIIPLKQGEILYTGNSSAKSSELITYLYQNPQNMFLQDCVKNDIELIPLLHNAPNIHEFCDEIITTFHLQQFKERNARILSGGQQRCTSLAIGLATTPDILLLDEPISSLDTNNKKALFQLLTLLDNQIKLSIIATHDLALVSEWATRVIIISKGEIIFDDIPQIFINSRFNVYCSELSTEEIS